MSAIFANIWLLGFFLTTYPAYRVIVKAVARENSSNRLDASEVFWSMVGSTLAGALWPLALPFVTSHFLHTRRLRTPRFVDEIRRYEDEIQGERTQLALRREAAREVTYQVMGLSDHDKELMKVDHYGSYRLSPADHARWVELRGLGDAS
jgi:hypothetical protein